MLDVDWPSSAGKRSWDFEHMGALQQGNIYVLSRLLIHIYGSFGIGALSLTYLNFGGPRKAHLP